MDILQRAADAEGRRTGPFVAAFQRWAAVYAKGGGQQTEGGAAVSGSTYEIVLPDDAETRTIAVTDRLVWKGRQMDIIRADLPDRMKMTITLAVRDERGG